MIKINQSYLHRFKLSRGVYMFYISPGLLLSFDKETLEYLGPITFSNRYSPIFKEIDDTLNNLISKGILEVF